MASDIVATLQIRAISDVAAVVKRDADAFTAANEQIKASSGATAASVDAGAASEVTASREVAVGAAEGAAAVTASHAKMIASINHVANTMMLVGGAAAAVTGGAVIMAAKYSSAMEMVRTQAGATQSEVDKMSQALLDMAGQVGQSPDALSAALFKIESAGIRGAAALRTLRAAAEGAAIGHANLTDVTTALVGVTNSHIKGVGNEKDAIASLIGIVGSGMMTLQDLTSALATGIMPAARTAGLSLQDVGAGLAVMTDQGIPASRAATQLSMAFSKIEAPTGTTVKALASIGLTSTQLAEDMRKPGGLLVAMEDLKKHLDDSGMTAVQQAAVIGQAFGGARTGKGIMELIGNLDQLKGKYAEQSAMAKQFGADWAATQKEVDQQWKDVMGTIDAVTIRLGQALLPAIHNILDAVLPLITATAKWAQAHTAVVVGVLALAGAIGVLGIGIKAATISYGLYKDAMDLWAAATGKAGVVTKGLAAAQWLLNAALSANPIGLAIIAVAALTAGFILLYTHSAAFRTIVGDIGAALTDLIAGAVNKAIGIFNLLKGAFEAVGSKLDGLTGSLGKGNAAILLFTGPLAPLILLITHWGQVTKAAGEILAWLGTNVISPLIDWVGKLIDKITSSVGAFQKLGSIIGSVFSAVGGALGHVGHVIDQHAKKHHQTHANMAQVTNDAHARMVAAVHSASVHIVNSHHNIQQAVKKTTDVVAQMGDAATKATDAAIAANNRLEQSTAASWKRMADSAIAQAQRIKAVLPTFTTQNAPGVTGPADAIGVQQQVMLGDKFGEAIRKQIEQTKIAASGSTNAVLSGAGSGGTNAGMSSAMSQMSGVFGQLGPQFAGAVAPVLQKYSDELKSLRDSEVQKVQTEDTRHEQALAAINKGHEEAVKAAEASAVSQRKALDAAWQQGQKNLQASQEQAVKAHQQSLAAANTTAIQALQATLLSHTQSLKSMSDAHDSKLQSLHDAYVQKLDSISGKNVEKRRELAKETYDRQVAAEDSAYARRKTAADQHIAATVTAFKNHEAARSAADQAWLNSRKGVDAVQQQKLAEGYKSHADAINAALQKHIASLNQAETDKLSKEDQAHQNHLHALQLAFQNHAALIEKAMKTASTPQAVWDAVTKGVGDQVSNDLKTLDLAVLEHKKNLGGLVTAEVSALAMQQQLTDAQSTAALMVAKAGGDLSGALKILTQQITDDTAKIASLIYSGTASTAIVAPTAGQRRQNSLLEQNGGSANAPETQMQAAILDLVKAYKEQYQILQAQNQAQLIAAKATGDWSTVIKLEGDKYSKAVDDATAKVQQDILKRGAASDKDVATLVAAEAAEKTFTDAQKQAALIVAQASGDYSTVLKGISDQISTNLSQAVDKVTLDIINHGSATQADIASAQAAQAAQDSYTESVWEAKFAVADLATQSQMLKDRFSQMVSDATTEQSKNSGVDSANLALIAEESKAQVAAMTNVVNAIKDQTAIISAQSGVAKATGEGQLAAIKDQGSIAAAQRDIAKATSQQQLIVAEDRLRLAQDQYRADQTKAAYDVAIAQMQVQIAMTKMAVDQANAAAQRVVQMDTLKLDTDKIQLAKDQLKLSEDQLVVQNTIATTLSKVNQYEALIAGDLASIGADQSQITQDNGTLAQDTGTAAAVAVQGQMQEAQQSQQLAMEQAQQQAADLQNQMQQAMDQNRLAADQANNNASTTNNLLQQQLAAAQDQNNSLLNVIAVMRRGSKFSWAGGSAFDGWLNNLNAESVANGGA